MPRGNPRIKEYAKGRPKGSKNKTPILLQELETIVYELSKEERMRRLRAYRDFSPAVNPHKNFVNIMLTIAKRQEDTGQADMFNDAEERAMIANAERQIREMERTGQTQ